MADLTSGLDEIVEGMADEDWGDDWVVAWTDEGDGVICVKPAAGEQELIETEDLTLFMASYGMHLGYGPGRGAADAQYQFKRME